MLEEFRQAYPNDPCLDLLLVDYYVLKKDFVRARESTDRLDKAVGGDPYLDVLRANLNMVAGDLKAARELANRAIKEEPGLTSAYASLLGVSVEEKNYAESLDLLRMLDQTHKIRIGDLAGMPEYAGFIKSPQYQEWRKYLAQKAAKQKVNPSKAPAATRKTPASSNSGLSKLIPPAVAGKGNVTFPIPARGRRNGFPRFGDPERAWPVYRGRVRSAGSLKVGTRTRPFAM